MNIEKIVAYSLFVIAIMLCSSTLLSTDNTIVANIYDTYYVADFKHAVYFYSTFISIIGFMLLIWSTKKKWFTDYLCIMILLCALSLSTFLLFSFNDDINSSYEWIALYSFAALIISTVIHLITKLFVK